MSGQNKMVTKNKTKNQNWAVMDFILTPDSCLLTSDFVPFILTPDSCLLTPVFINKDIKRGLL